VREAHREAHQGEFDDVEALTAASADMITVATADGVYRYVSPASRRLFLWDPADLGGRHQDQFAHPDDVPSMRAAMRSSLQSDGFFTMTYRFRCGDDSYRWIEATYHRVEAGGESFVVGSVRDIAERKKADVLLQHRASTDPLTGVANRNVLIDRMQHALHRLGRSPGILAVLFLDLDRFKVINDSLGHHVGDGVLMSMADRLLGFIRPADTLARLGGDEFVIVAEDLTDEHEAVALGRRIAEAGRKPFRIGAEEFVCTVSVGIATTSDAHHSPDSLLQEADLALYRAKDRGRDRAEVFDEDLRTTAVGRLGTERMLRRAIDEERLRVQYQPIIDLRSGRVVSVEALVRVFDSELGVLEPEAFLTVAEETGLLATMDEWVFAEAIQEATRWCDRLGENCPRLNLNVTSRRVADASFYEAVVGALDSKGLSRNSMQVEVTERVLMEASNSALAALRALRAGGIQVGLDDFGTGFSSLSYLRQFPLDFVKIDKSFVHGLGRGSGEHAIVNAIIGLSHAFGLEVVAEGVETRGQLESLTELGCDQAQGFLLASPGEPHAVEELVLAGGLSWT
jgi:diguanylate cyclase (GGDEF)-like protein/PAS domain S-box-containing protein